MNCVMLDGEFQLPPAIAGTPARHLNYRDRGFGGSSVLKKVRRADS